MGRIVKFSIVDAAGVGAAGQKVTAGDFELTTTSTGAAQALLDDGPTTVTVNGVTVFEGRVEDLRALEVFTATGERIG